MGIIIFSGIRQMEKIQVQHTSRLRNSFQLFSIQFFLVLTGYQLLTNLKIFYNDKPRIFLETVVPLSFNCTIILPQKHFSQTMIFIGFSQFIQYAAHIFMRHFTSNVDCARLFNNTPQNLRKFFHPEWVGQPQDTTLWSSYATNRETSTVPENDDSTSHFQNLQRGHGMTSRNMSLNHMSMVIKKHIELIWPLNKFFLMSSQYTIQTCPLLLLSV